MADLEPIHYQETSYGFEYGAASVERTASYKGYVVLTIRTRRGVELEVTVTPTGFIRTKTRRIKRS